MVSARVLVVPSQTSESHSLLFPHAEKPDPGKNSGLANSRRVLGGLRTGVGRSTLHRCVACALVQMCMRTCRTASFTCTRKSTCMHCIQYMYFSINRKRDTGETERDRGGKRQTEGERERERPDRVKWRGFVCANCVLKMMQCTTKWDQSAMVHEQKHRFRAVAPSTMLPTCSILRLLPVSSKCQGTSQVQEASNAVERAFTERGHYISEFGICLGSGCREVQHERRL